MESMVGKFKSSKSHIDYATIEISLKKKTLPGPLGFLYNCIGEIINKLFVLN